MQFSKNWLKDFIDIDLSTEDICSQLTMAGLEVEGYEAINSKITGKDAIIKLDITPNRGDCFSVLGVARELSVINNLKLSLPNISSIESSFKDEMKVKACAEAPSYFGRTIRDISINSKTLPLIAERLKFSDQKLIDPVVDITNYILLELGQPLHAFDRDKLRGNITVRTAFNKEKIKLLDDQELVLDDSCLVISDEESAVAFAGIMGGKESAVSASTNSIFLESAFFKPSIIRGKARRYGFQTDASLRFERGVDYKIQKIAIDRASILLRDTVGGRFSEVTSSTLKNQLPKQTKINLDLEKSNGLLGTKISKQVALRYFKGLGFAPESLKKSSISAIPPSWRYDLTIEADLVEEVARVASLTKLVGKPFARSHLGVLKPVLTLQQNRERIARRTIAALGYNECVTYSFIDTVSAKLFGGGADATMLSNPISSEMSHMRPSLLPGLLQAAARNQARGILDMALFEVGAVWHGGEPDDQETQASGVLIGSTGPKDVYNTRRAVDIFDAKADVEMVLNALGSPNKVQFQRGLSDWWHSGRSARMALGKTSLAVFGEIHPKVLVALNVKGPVVAFVVHTKNIPTPKVKSATRSALHLKSFQAVERDFAFVVDQSVEAITLVNAAKAADKFLIEDVRVFDEFFSDVLGEGRKSLALTVRLQPTEAKFKDYEIEAVAKKVVEKVIKATGGVLRT